jgi:hypothetical protein
MIRAAENHCLLDRRSALLLPRKSRVGAADVTQEPSAGPFWLALVPARNFIYFNQRRTLMTSSLQAQNPGQ